MIVFFACLMVGFCCALLGCWIGWDWHPQSEAESAVDRKRRLAKEEGLVLNMPAYMDGIECYCRPTWVNIKLRPRDLESGRFV